MLERHFARPRTWDRIRGSWIGPAIEKYVDWLEERRCAQRTICYRVPVLEQFGHFAKAAGASTWSDLPQYVDPFVKHRIRERGGRHPSERVRRRLRHATQIPVEQMLRLNVPGFHGARRENMPLPLLRQVPGFFLFLHVSPQSTAVYLTVTADLLAQANDRFQRFAASAVDPQVSS